MTVTAPPLARFVDAARAAHSSALVVLHDGAPIIEEYLDGAPRPIEAMSVTKAVVSLIVGRAVTLGHLEDVDVKVSDLFPEWRQGRKRAITVRHLLNHTTGLQNEPATSAEIYPSEDFVQLALCAELSDDPGAKLSYNNKAFNLLAGVIRRATGRRMDEFARDELFAPLGITDFTWATDPSGNPQCMAGFGVRPFDLAKLGHLLLTRGDWEGRRVIDEAWFDLSLAPTTPASSRIGLAWWLVSAWEKRVVDVTHAEAWRAAGVPENEVRALTGLAGEYGRQELARALQEALGSDWLRKVQQRPAAFTELTGPTRAYLHDGDLGQYLAVLPNSRLVAVRMIDWQSPHTHDPVSTFADFLSHALALEDEMLRGRDAPPR